MKYVHLLVSPVGDGTRAIALPRLPRYVRLSIRAMAFFTLAIALMIGAAQANERPVDLFIAFRDAFLSQTKKRLITFRFTCHVAEVFAASFGEDYCLYTLSNGPFSQVRATVIDGTSRTLTFTVRKNALRLVDLVALWGWPLRYSLPSVGLTFYWPTQQARALADDDRAAQSISLLPLRQVSFTEKAAS